MSLCLYLSNSCSSQQSWRPATRGHGSGGGCSDRLSEVPKKLIECRSDVPSAAAASQNPLTKGA